MTEEKRKLINGEPEKVTIMVGTFLKEGITGSSKTRVQKLDWL